MKTKIDISTKAIAIGAISMLVVASVFVWLMPDGNSPIQLEILGADTQQIDINNTAIFTIRANNTDAYLNHSVNLTIDYDATEWFAYLSVWNLTINATNSTIFFLFVVPNGAGYGDSITVDVWGTDETNETTNTVSATVSINVPNVPPVADFTWSPILPTDLQNIQFNDLSTDADGTITAWYWDFGDGTNSTEQNPQKQYAENGVYNVSLTVWDDDGDSNSVSYMITVLNVPPTVAIDTPIEGAIVSGNIVISGTASDSDGNVIGVWVRIDGGTWELATGTDNWNYNLDTTTLPNGLHTIEAISQDNDGDYSAIPLINFTVSNVVPPVANFKGYVYDNSTGLPIENVFVIAGEFGGNVTFTTTDASGYYELSIPGDFTFFFIAGQHQINGTFDYLMHFKGQANLGENETRWYNFTLYPMPEGAYNNMIYGYVYDENGTPLQDIGILIYDLNYPNSILPWMLGVNTNESGYYERPIYNGTFLVGFNLMSENEGQVQGNLSQITVNGDTNVSRTLLPSQEGGTINLTFLNGWNDIALEGRFWTNRDAETFRFMWDFLLGNGNGIFEQEELDLLLQFIGQGPGGPEVPDNTTDIFTVDNLWYDTTYWNFTYEVQLGSVLLKTPAEMVMKLNGTINGTIPTQSTHVIKGNISYDDTGEGGPTNAIWYITLPSDYVLAGYSQTSAIVSGVGTNVIVVDMGNDPNTTDNITSEWIEFYTTIPPTADFTYSPLTPTTSDIIQFTDNSTDTDGTIIAWYWDFGDGTNSTLQNPQKQYSDDITYTVSLTVWDDTGATDTISQQITIGNSPPTVAITSPNEWDFVNGIVNILGTANDDDPITVEVRIIGINYDTNWNLAGGTNNWNYLWDTTPIKNGVYKIQARIIDDNSSSSTDEIMVIVNNTIEGNYPPTVNITSPLNNATVSGQVNITGTSADADGVVIIVLVRIDNETWQVASGTDNWTYIWDTNSVGNGNHTISAKSIDNDGSESNISQVIVNVNNPIPNQPPIADFNYNPPNPTTDDIIQFNDLSTDADGTIVNWTWNFGDGSALEYTPNPTHQYTTSGIYIATLTVRDDGGLIDSESKLIFVDSPANQNPTVNITSPTDNETVEGTVIISGTANDADGTVILVHVRIDGGAWQVASGTDNWQYSWDTTSVANGNHLIDARAFDNNGDVSNIASVNVNVDNNALPNADFNWTSEETNYTVQFNDLSTDADGTITAWYWDFGDNSSSTLQNPTHQYANAGIYLVSLTITDNRGGSDSISKVVIVNPVENIPPEVSITSPGNFEIINGIVNIQGTSSDSDGIVQTVGIAIDNGTWNLANGTNNWNYNWDTTTVSDGTHTIYANATDDDGSSTIAFVNVIVDNSPPTTQGMFFGTLGNNGWYVSPLTVVLTATDGTSGVNKTYYKFWMDGEIEPAYEEGNIFTIISSGTWNIKYYATDNAGNNENPISTQVKIDNDLPYSLSIIIENGYQYTNSRDVSLDLSATDDTSGVSEMQLSNDGINWSVWEPYNTRRSWTLKNGDGTKTVYFRVKDNAGNIAMPVSDDIILDTVAPETSAELSGTEGENGWYVSNVDVLLSATDDISGVYKTYYKMWNSSSSEPVNFTEGNSFTLSGTEVWYVRYYSEDNAGNLENIHSFQVNIDKTLPSSLTIRIDNDNQYTADTSVVLSLSASDSDSGVGQMQFSNDGNIWSDWESYGGSKNWILTDGDGTKTVYFRVKDNAGNIAIAVSDDIILDTVAPETSYSISGTLGNDGWYLTNSTITFTGDDDTSGINRTYYKVWQGSEPGSYNEGNSVTVNQEGITNVKYYSVDNAGNSETPKTFQIKIDRTNPSTTHDAPTGWQKNFITVSFSASDQRSGIDKTYYKRWLSDEPEPPDYIQGTSTYLNQDGIWNIRYYSTDKAGNSETKKLVSVSIDTTNPNIEHFFKGANYTMDDTVYISPNTKISLTYDDETSGISKVEYRLNQENWTTYTNEFTLTEDGKYVLDYQAIDNAGNTKTSSVIIERTSVSVVIDKDKLEKLRSLIENTTFVAGQSYEKLFKLSDIFINFGSNVEYNITSSIGTITVEQYTGYDKFIIDSTSGQIVITIDIDSWVSIYPALNFSGTISITFIAEQGTRATQEQFALEFYINYIPHGVKLNNIPLIEGRTNVITGTYYAKDTLTFNVSVEKSTGKTFNYIWEFGEGKPKTTTNNAKTTYTYDKYGTYFITLTIEYPADSTSAYYEMIIAIKDKPPIAKISPPDVVSPYTNQSVEFSGSDSADIDGTIVAYEWNFGDGYSASGVNATHRYTKAGTYTITLSVIDDFGNRDSTTISLVVRSYIIGIDVLIDGETRANKTVNVGDAVEFRANATSTYSPIVSYIWNFDDGTSGVGSVVSHRFNKADRYEVTITATNGVGETATKTVTIIVVEKPSPPDYTWILYVLLGVMIVLFIILLLMRVRRRPTELPELEEELPIKPPSVPPTTPKEIEVQKEEEVKVEEKKEAEEMFQCSLCGGLVIYSAKSCPYCGAVFEEEKPTAPLEQPTEAKKEEDKFECSECGTLVEKTAKSCPSCGKVFEEKPTTLSEQPTEEKKEEEQIEEKKEVEEKKEEQK